MDARQVIMAIRDGAVPDAAALRWFANGLADGGVSDAQAGAFAMAVLLRGLGDAGRVALTQAMRDSGDCLAWALNGPVWDKHSTGGIGDCVSLVLAPALASCGVYVPMISGRGLGHTGGTLDKMEAIPGLSTQGDEARLRAIVDAAGCAIVGASARIAPADRRLYGVRDVSGAVESIDLITASILSKKLAAGLDGLVLDVKTGSGAFMAREEDARALAQALVATANGAGCMTTAVLSDMSSPLAPSVGNGVEIADVMRVLRGEQTGRLHRLSVVLGGIALMRAGLAETDHDGEAMITRAIADGRAAERFGVMVAAQGGARNFVERYAQHLPTSPVVQDVLADRTGVVSAMDGRALGNVVVALGGGRQVETDQVDPSVGLSEVVAIGTPVAAGQVLARLHARDGDVARRGAQKVQAAITITDEAAPDVPLVLGRIG